MRGPVVETHAATLRGGVIAALASSAAAGQLPLPGVALRVYARLDPFGPPKAWHRRKSRGSAGLIDLHTPLHGALHDTDEKIVDAGVIGEFWMESGGKHEVLLHRNRAAVI